MLGLTTRSKGIRLVNVPMTRKSKPPAAAVGEMNLSARHTGDHNRRAGHVDLLNVHAILDKEAFFLRDPKRAHPGADIGVTDDYFRRREKKSWCEDNAKCESCC